LAQLPFQALYDLLFVQAGDAFQPEGSGKKKL
jgi:hypothetical protein